MNFCRLRHQAVVFCCVSSTELTEEERGREAGALSWGPFLFWGALYYTLSSLHILQALGLVA